MSPRPRSRLVVLLALAVAAALAGACGDASRIFSGRWVSTEVLDSGWITGRPELAIGHFGPEVTGVVYFANAAGIASGPCSCAFLDHQSVDLKAERFRVTSELSCEGPGDGAVWLWDLGIERDENDDLFLVGTVETTDGTEQRLPLRLALLDRFVPADHRECE